jgi:hypothetical protein
MRKAVDMRPGASPFSSTAIFVYWCFYVIDGGLLLGQLAVTACLYSSTNRWHDIRYPHASVYHVIAW